MNTLEWSNFILSLPNDELLDTAIHLGSQAFIDSMLEKNIPLEDILQIHKLVAQKFLTSGRLIPQVLDGCVVNYYNILYPPTQL
jgi:hypothetical protein